jgi:hypothetical protein
MLAMDEARSTGLAGSLGAFSDAFSDADEPADTMPEMGVAFTVAGAPGAAASLIATFTGAAGRVGAEPARSLAELCAGGRGAGRGALAPPEGLDAGAAGAGAFSGVLMSGSLPRRVARTRAAVGG